MENEIYIGLDVHSESITVAVAERGREGEVRDQGKIPNDRRSVEKLVARMRKAHGADCVMHLCYEAGPCGFGLVRQLWQLGLDCVVVAPSLIPKRPGDRIKTDRRDARKLARLLRAGELTSVYIPEPTDEAMRDLCRTRTDAVDDRRRARSRLKAFLLRHGYKGKGQWSAAYLQYLHGLNFEHPAMKRILDDYLKAIDAAGERIEQIEEAMRELLEAWRLRPAVQALMAMRGFQLVGAMVMVSELGNIHRFEHPRQLMAYLGLVPSEHTSDDQRHQGPLTKTGNGHARWLLVESAHHYPKPPKVGRGLAKRQIGQSPEVKRISWKAQKRLHERFHHLAGRGLLRNKAVVAIARELCGFVWAVLRTQDCYRAKSLCGGKRSLSEATAVPASGAAGK